MCRLFIAFVFLLSSCSDKYSTLKQNLSLREQKLGIGTFSFSHKNDTYFFEIKHFKQDGRECDLYHGYKNGQLTYAFNRSLFYSIEKFYKANDKPEAIKSYILEKLDDQRPEAKTCYEKGRGPAPDAGQGVGILILFFPVAVPFLAYSIVKSEKYYEFQNKISQAIRIGAQKRQIPAFLSAHWRKKQKGSSEYYEYINRNRRLKIIFYFEKDRLNAYSISYYSEK